MSSDTNAENTGISPVQVLLIEENQDDLRRLREIFAEIGPDQCRLTHVKRIKDAGKKLSDEAFDIILVAMDLDSHGLEMLEQLRKLALHLPIVVLTPLDWQDTIGEAMARGVQDYLFKQQVDAPQLARSLRYSIQIRQLENNLAYYEQQARHLQKMETVGILARGVGHNFNNIMTIISGYSELLLNKPETPESSARLIREIQSAARRSDQLMQHLLAYTTVDETETTEVDVNSLLNGMDKLLRPLISSNVQFVFIPALKLNKVQANSSLLEHIIVNLVVSSCETMPKGGTLTIETSNTVLDESFVSPTPDFKPGPFVLITVSDTGTGLDKSLITELFSNPKALIDRREPISLTLATLYGLVRQCNGQISVYTEPGQGTTFNIYLPRHKGRKTQTVEDESDSPSAEDLKGHETVLLVDDEEGIRSMVSDALTIYGYKVIEASNGEEAIQESAKFSGDIHLLITDLVMPKMGGRELAENLRPFHGDMKILFMSGYTAQAAYNLNVLEQDVPFIHKPFSVDHFLTKVRELLDAN